jgi:GAF domain-containing protein
MLERFRRSPRPQQLSEGERRLAARTLRTLLLISLFADVAALILTVVGGFGLQLIVPIALLLLFQLISLAFLQRGILLPAQILLPTTLFFVVSYLVASGYGLHDINVLAFAVVISLAALTLGQRAAFIFAGLIIAFVFWVGFAEIRGILVSPTSSLTLPVSPIAISIVLLAMTFIQQALINLLNENVRRARENEQAQLNANLQLRELQGTLELRISERTQEAERRAKRLKLAAEIGSATASFRNLDHLLVEAVGLLGRGFDFYHAGIFLVDERQRYAVLRAANSEGGMMMLRQGHKLAIGKVGIVGNVAETGKARIALDVGADSVFFDNPALPDTHSEMALPLRVAGRIVGVLDLQSLEPNAFKTDDIETLQVVADQLAIAIENSRLLGESLAAVEATRRAYGEVATEAWKQRLQSQGDLAFRSAEYGEVVQLYGDESDEESKQAVQSGKVIRSKDDTTLSIPIILRGQPIGVMRLVKAYDSHWSESELTAVQTLADQLGSALDSARLYDESQRRVDRERAIAELSAKIGNSSNVDAILHSMTEELGKMLSDSEVVVQLARE